MLRLLCRTDAAWAERARPHLDTILVDHAHCEKKAASTAVALLFRYPEEQALLRPLAALAREELEHFEQVLDLLRLRGTPFRRLPPSHYAARLHGAVRRDEPGRLVDTLLVCALIEARSCDRMTALCEVLDGPAGQLYRSLLASEARHHQVYVDLATGLSLRAEALDRLTELARWEAEVILGANEPDRLHG